MHAIVSDIHGNLPAAEAVFADIKEKGVSRIVSLGDTVGYGPFPAECIDLVRKHCEVGTYGNHDIAVLTGAFGFRKHAREAVDWTREQLKPGKIARFTPKGARWSFLRDLPDRYQEGRVLYVHASPREPVVEYILESDVADMGFGPSEKMRDIFSRIDRLCFVGHTHQPGIFTGDFRHIRPSKLENGTYTVPENGKTICNVGSVGQPRDRDPRACYVTLDGDVVRYHRVEYDIQRVIDRINEIPRLDERLGARLQLGK